MASESSKPFLCFSGSDLEGLTFLSDYISLSPLTLTSRKGIYAKGDSKKERFIT
jgi:hypothetical protein